MRRLDAWAVVAVLLWATGVFAGPNDVLVAVQPASDSLTRARHERIVNFIEWAFKAPLTNEQRKRLGDIVVEEWKDPTTREEQKGWLEAADETEKFPAEQRPLVREKLLEQMLPALRESAKTDAAAKWFLGVWEAANKPLVPGKPPLMRQAVEASLEMLYFTIGKAHGVDAKPSAADYDEAVKSMVAAWPKLSAERKAEVAGAPMQWADLRAAWDAASQRDREEVAAQWREAFPLPEAKPSPFSTTPAQRKALAKLKEIDDALAAGRTGEVQRFANELKTVVAELRKDPNSKGLADQVAQVQAQLQSAAQAQAQAKEAAAQQARQQVAQAQSQGTDFAKKAAALNAMMAAHRSQMAHLEQMRQMQFNMNANLGNSPYRYTNSFGNPW